MLDWSFNLLSDRDRRVLGRLSIFVGVFALEAAQVVAADDQTDAMEVADSIAGLIDKSLIWVLRIDGSAYHRLLDPTQAYAAEKLAQTVGANTIAKRHALYYAEWLSSGPGKNAAAAGLHLGNIRTALEWSFSGVGDASIGVRLAAAAVRVFFELSLLIECRRWCEQCLNSLPADYADGATRLALQATLAASAMFTLGNGNEVRKIIEDSLELAESLGDRLHQMHLLSGLNIFLTRIGDFRGAVAIAQRSVIVAQQIGSPGAIATGEWMLGVGHHLVGDQAAAQRHCERGLAEAAASDTTQIFFFGYDHRIRALIALARCFWLGGFPDRAAMTARRAIDEAAKQDHPVNLCIAMIYSATVFLWRGDFDEAEHLIKRLIAHASRHSLGPYHTIGLALTGEHAVARGDPSVGVPLLRRALGLLQDEQYNVLTPAFYRAIAEGLMQLGENAEAAAMLDAALARSEALGESLNVPELLRVRGELWLRAKPADPLSAERAFQLSLQHAKAQSAPSLELRSAMGLARLWSGQGRRAEAGGLLETVYRRFAEGHQTMDLKLASQLLAEFGRHVTLEASGSI